MDHQPAKAIFQGLRARMRADSALDVLVISDSGYWLAGHWDPERPIKKNRWSCQNLSG